MSGGDNMRITLSYKIQASGTWIDLILGAEEYFDSQYIEPDEKLNIDSLPLYDHGIDYIEIPDKQRITNTRLTITNAETHRSKTITETYWNSQKNSMVEVRDIGCSGNTDYYEIILTSLVSDSPAEDIWEIIRFSRNDGILTPTLHTFITENDQGFVSERMLNEGLKIERQES